MPEYLKGGQRCFLFALYPLCGFLIQLIHRRLNKKSGRRKYYEKSEFDEKRFNEDDVSFGVAYSGFNGLRFADSFKRISCISFLRANPDQWFRVSYRPKLVFHRS
jgi:hypothetical protein